MTADPVAVPTRYSLHYENKPTVAYEDTANRVGLFS